MKQIANRTKIVADFNKAIEFKLVRKGTRKFVFINPANEKQGFLECKTRLDAAVSFAARYATPQVYADKAFANPVTVAKNCGLDMAIDLLLFAGLICVKEINGQETFVRK